MPNDHPLLTFALVAFEQERFISEAVQGAFSQTYAPLQIILSDDGSKDRTFDIIQEMAAQYRGPHQVITRRNARNLGLGAHINQVMELARGQMIVIAAGDDVSLPHRTERLWQENLASGGKAYSIFSNEYLIDEFGNKRALSRRNPPDPDKLTLNWFTLHAASITGSSHAWRREVFDLFGPLGDGVVSEDTAIPFRSLLLGSISYIHEPLVLRRYTGKNLSLGALQSWDRDASVEGFHRFVRRFTRNLESVYESRLVDIDRFLQGHPEQRQSLGPVRTITEQKVLRVSAETRFWESSNPHKLQMLYRDFVRNGFLPTAIRLFLSWMFPQIYLRWFHWVSFKQRGKLAPS